jgi:hypothetical protein
MGHLGSEEELVSMLSLAEHPVRQPAGSCSTGQRQTGKMSEPLAVDPG